MPKYWGVNFDIKEIEENGRKRKVIIAMTEKEANDRIYREELNQVTEEKTRQELRNMPKPNVDPKKREALGAIYKEYLQWKKEGGKKYY